MFATETTGLDAARRFSGDCRGNVTMMLGLSITMLVGATGGAIDFARLHQAKSKAQAALDSATLAGGRALQLSPSGDATEAIAAATGYFEKMRPIVAAGATPAFTIRDNATAFRGEVLLAVPSYFLGVFGIPSLRSNLISETVIAAGGNAGTNLEISLMLDTTGSMSGQKIDDLKLAAKDLIDIVVWNDQSQYTSKVALSPFSTRVNVGSYIQQISDVQTTRGFGGGVHRSGITCVTERTGPEAFTDAKPVGQHTLSANSGDKGNTARDNADNYSQTGECQVSSTNSTPLAEIMPLTSNKTALKDRIDSLPASGGTAGSLGTAWAWYMLSPRWTGIWQGENLPAPYSDLTTPGPRGTPKLYKVAVLMTDGIYNTFGGEGGANATTISSNAVTLCNNMKAAGIKVYTVGFQLGGEQLAIDTLKACASREPNDPAESPSYFFAAESGSDLRGAFRQIALQLSTLRIRM